jgi:hypothetical protein
MATLLNKPHPDFDQRDGETFDAFVTRSGDALKVMQKKCMEAAEKGLTGCVIRFPAADGFAWYLVAKESPLTLQHLNYMDGYSVHPAMIRGLRKADVQALVETEAAHMRFFSRQNPLPIE